MHLNNSSKIIIIGEAGRGKSTLAKKLSVILNIPEYSTDDMYYEIKFNKIREKSEALTLANKISAENKWIIEGTTIWLIEPFIQKADLIIFLKHKNILSQWLILMKRHISRKEETLSGLLYLMRHVFYKRYNLGYKKGKTTHIEFIDKYSSKTVTLTSFKEIDLFIKNNC